MCSLQAQRFCRFRSCSRADRSGPSGPWAGPLRRGGQVSSAVGAEVHRGSLEDLGSLRSGAAISDGVIHTAFIHDFANYGPAAEADRRAIETLGAVLAGSDRPLIVSSGSWVVAPGRVATEDDTAIPDFPRKSEEAALAMASRGVRASVVRLAPSVQGKGIAASFRASLTSPGRSVFRRIEETGVAAGPECTDWMRRICTGWLLRKVRRQRGIKGLPTRAWPAQEIAEVIGRRLNVPVVCQSHEEAAEHFGWIAQFIAMDGPPRAGTDGIIAGGVHQWNRQNPNYRAKPSSSTTISFMVRLAAAPLWMACND